MSARLNPDQASPAQTGEIVLPDIPCLALSRSRAHVLECDGEIRELSFEEAGRRFHKKSAMVCHAPYTSRRLNLKNWAPYDLLELFAFTYPGRFCVPTPFGLLKATGLSSGDQKIVGEDIVLGLYEAAQSMMENLTRQNDENILSMVEVMGLNGRGWGWTPFVFESFGQSYDPKKPLIASSAYNVWKNFPEWSEKAPKPPPGHAPVSEQEAKERLSELLTARHGRSEPRPQQTEYAQKLIHAFQPVYEDSDPNIVLAEAGTGVGKTLGYLAPASVWAEKNDGAVWISTYTKSLQRQIQTELDSLYPEKDLNQAHIAMRKGRENYLCLLNLEEKAGSAGIARDPVQPVALGIMARWVAHTQDGDLTGRDFPSWLTSLLGYQYTIGLADKRGECIYSACDHYHRCFVEKSIRKSRHARLVVANHAVVMIQAAMAGEQAEMPQRYIFDEGHHLFSAADSAFSAHLTGREGYDLRRWILGAGESGSHGKSRARGLRRRIEDLVSGDPEGEKLLDEVTAAARLLPDERWASRLKSNEPQGIFEQVMHLVFQQVWARGKGREGPYSLEGPTFPVSQDMIEKSRALKTALMRLHDPISKLAGTLEKRLEDDEGMLESDTRKRLDAVAQMLKRKARTMISPWVEMLKSVELGQTPEEFVDWMEIERLDGRVIDVGLYRHFVDPMKAFSASLRPFADGVVVTSATLQDQTDLEPVRREHDSEQAKAIRNMSEETGSETGRETGMRYLSDSPLYFRKKSPFDYAEQTRVLVIQDVDKNNPAQTAAAFKTLFKASGGGAMGLFTAIQRLRAVYNFIHRDLEADHMTLYAQHVDPLDSGTLVDIFREDVKSCLLGTDAMRDGVDIPGDSLQLLVFDKVPWPRPRILHKARKQEFGGRHYDDRLTRLKIKQAYGRLIRQSQDRGVFVMLDSGMPSRLYTAFPDGVEIQKVGLAQAATIIKDFLPRQAD